MRPRKISLSKVPYIDDIAIKDKCLGLDRIEVAAEFFSMATIRP